MAGKESQPEWNLQEEYTAAMHERVTDWISKASAAATTPQKREFLEWLSTSVTRRDVHTASLVDGLRNHADTVMQGYGRTPGSINSPAGETFCQAQFKGLWAIHEFGKSKGK